MQIASEPFKRVLTNEEMTEIQNNVMSPFNNTPVEKTVEELFEEYRDACMDYGVYAPDRKRMAEVISEVKQQVKKDIVSACKQLDVNTWLHNVYGLTDDSLLNAGEVEELLEQYKNDIVNG